MNAEWLASTEELRRYLIFNGGLKITTTIDPHAQQLAEAAAAENPVKASNPNSEVAMVTVDTQTGGVRAVVGEVDIGGQPIEIAQPLDGRSSGSSFKPFTLIAAIEAGYSVNSTISGAYMPLAKKKQIFAAGASQLSRNYPEDCPSQGQVVLSKALAESNNCAFMRLQGAIGFEKVKQTAAKLGLTESRLDPLRGQAACFTIGCDALVRPIDMADAYATIGNDGKRNPAHFISKVEDRNGKVLYEYQPSDQQVIAPDVARQATSAMRRRDHRRNRPRRLAGEASGGGQDGHDRGRRGRQHRSLVRRVHPPGHYGGVDRQPPQRHGRSPGRQHPGRPVGRGRLARLHGAVSRERARRRIPRTGEEHQGPGDHRSVGHQGHDQRETRLGQHGDAATDDDPGCHDDARCDHARRNHSRRGHRDGPRAGTVRAGPRRRDKAKVEGRATGRTRDRAADAIPGAPPWRLGSAPVGSLDALLTVQDLDTRTDQLRHRRETLPERGELAAAQRSVKETEELADVARTRLRELKASEKALEDEAATVEAHAADIQRKMYDGSITAAKELEAFQTDHEHLKKRQVELEDRAIEILEAGRADRGGARSAHRSGGGRDSLGHRDRRAARRGGGRDRRRGRTGAATNAPPRPAKCRPRCCRPTSRCGSSSVASVPPGWPATDARGVTSRSRRPSSRASVTPRTTRW